MKCSIPHGFTECIVGNYCPTILCGRPTELGDLSDERQEEVGEKGGYSIDTSDPWLKKTKNRMIAEKMGEGRKGVKVEI